VGSNFCPFAAKPLNNQSIRYIVTRERTAQAVLDLLLQEYRELDRNKEVETTFIILPEGFEYFDTYLQLVRKANKYAVRKGYDGIYQIADFHPEYLFAGADENDAANYTNRSVFPMLHLLREQSISKALRNFAEPGSIPERNMKYARAKGLAYMQWLRSTCM
jgi:hypothetical protein